MKSVPVVLFECYTISYALFESAVRPDIHPKYPYSMRQGEWDTDE